MSFLETISSHRDITSLIVFGICIILFICNKFPIAVTALLGLSAMMLFNLVSFNDAFRNFGSSTVVLICSMMTVGRATLDTGLAQLIGNRVIRLAKGNERLIIIYGSTMTAVVSAFLPNLATLAIMISIMTGVCSSNDKVKFKNVILPVSMAAVIGGSATLIGSTTQLTGNGILESYLGAGNGFSFLTFSIPGVIIILAMVLYIGFIGYPLGKRIWGGGGMSKS